LAVAVGVVAALFLGLKGVVWRGVLYSHINVYSRLRSKGISHEMALHETAASKLPKDSYTRLYITELALRLGKSESIEQVAYNLVRFAEPTLRYKTITGPLQLYSDIFEKLASAISASVSQLEGIEKQQLAMYLWGIYAAVFGWPTRGKEGRFHMIGDEIVRAVRAMQL